MTCDDRCARQIMKLCPDTGVFLCSVFIIFLQSIENMSTFCSLHKIKSDMDLHRTSPLIGRATPPSGQTQTLQLAECILHQIYCHLLYTQITTHTQLCVTEQHASIIC